MDRSAHASIRSHPSVGELAAGGPFSSGSPRVSCPDGSARATTGVVRPQCQHSMSVYATQYAFDLTLTSDDVFGVRIGVKAQ
jgi:hypothetical protein